MNKRWINAVLAILLSSTNAALPGSADDGPANEGETARQPMVAPETSGDASESPEAVANEIDIVVDGASVDQILKTVTESLDLSVLSEDVKASIVDGVRKGLEAGERSRLGIDGSKNTEDAPQRATDSKGFGAIVLPKGVFIDGSLGRYRIELKDNGLRVLGLEGSKLSGDLKDFRIGHRVTQQKLKRYAIGIALAPNATELSEGQIALKIDSVFKDSPAEKAGMKAGDTLVSIDDVPLESPSDMINRINAAGEAGKSVLVSWMRDGKSLSAEIKPTDQPVDSSLGVGVQVIRAIVDSKVADGSDDTSSTIKDKNVPDSGRIEREAIMNLKQEVASLRDEIKEIKELIQANK